MAAGAALCEANPNCVAFVAYDNIDAGGVDCYFYTQMYYTTDEQNATVYYYQEKAGKKNSWLVFHLLKSL